MRCLHQAAQQPAAADSDPLKPSAAELNWLYELQQSSTRATKKASCAQDAVDQHWGCPIRECWGLISHQQLSLALEDKLAFTITATASYEEAAALAQKWGVRVTDSSLHALTQRLGSRAEKQKQPQLKTPPPEMEPEK
jgi:hypothetical protein